MFVGLVFVLLGLALFLEGLEMALFPLGRLMAEQLTAPGFILGEGAADIPDEDAPRDLDVAFETSPELMCGIALYTDAPVKPNF